MKDREFITWIHERLIHVHGENPSFDYMHKLRSIIHATPVDQESPNSNICCAVLSEAPIER